MEERLWEINEEIQELANYIGIIEDSDLNPSVKDAKLERYFNSWLAINEKFNSKAENVAKYIKYLEALTKARQEEYRRLRELANQSEARAKQLREYLVKQMMVADKAKIEGTTCNISLRKKPDKVILEKEPQDIPPEYQKVEITAKLSAIKKMLKDNPDCDWASLSKLPDYSLMIK